MKRLVASALVLTLTASMATAAFAQNPESDAAIEFVFDDDFGTGPGVLDPRDPEDEDLVNPALPDLPDEDDRDVRDYLDSISIDFHIRDLPTTNVTYQSWYTTAPTNPNWDTTRNWQSRAGIAVVTHLPSWTVQVDIGHFTNQNSPHPYNHTMLGYNLRLTPNGNPFIGMPPTAQFEFSNGGASTPNLNPTSGAAVVASGTAGFTGGNWEGEIDVLAFSAHTGQSQAELTWSFVTAP